MNVLDYSLKLGRLLQETKEGVELLQLKASVEGKYKKNTAFGQYKNRVEIGFSQYYFYSWDFAYKQIAAVLENDPINNREPFTPAAELITSDNEVAFLAEKSVLIGEIFEEIVAAIITGADYEKVIPSSWRFKIKNAISDVQIAVERTLLPREMVIYTSQHNDLLKDDSTQKYLDSRDQERLLPFSDEAMKRMNAAKDVSDEAKILFEKLYLMTTVVKRGIFHGFLGMLNEIGNDQLITGNDFYGMPLHEVTLSFKDRDSFGKGSIYKIQFEDGYKFFISYKKRVAVIEEKITISGIIYPIDDRRLFKNETST